MQFSMLGLITVLVGMALGQATSLGRQDAPSSDVAFDYGAARESAAETNPDLAQSSGGGGMWGCYMPQWSHGCAYFPARNGCQNVDLMNDQGGRVSEIHSLGPDYGTRCQVFAGADCSHGFYPKHDIPTPDWSIGYPGVAETADAVRSFKCFVT